MTQILEAIVGLQAGDEGKGKIVDERAVYAQEVNPDKRTVVVRYQGGTNAGHTLNVPYKGSTVKFVTHAAPSGITNGADIALGPNVAFNPEIFLSEVEEARRLFEYQGRILISERAGVLLDYHQKLDVFNEKNDIRNVGATGSGISPFYQDNARRVTRITFAEYISEQFPDKLKEALTIKKRELTEAEILTPHYEEELLVRHQPIRRALKKYSERLEYRLRKDYLEKGDNIIIEGAQGTMLDVDMGTIPDTTASHLLAPNAFASLGLPRKAFEIIGIEKVYPTRVGKGILPTLANDEFGRTVQQEAGEVGATTGRKRRVGYPDWVFIKYAAMLNDCDSIILTRVDNVQDKELKVCVGYSCNGETIKEVPLDLRGVLPIYNNKTYKWHLWHANEKSEKAWKANYIQYGFDNFSVDLQYFIADHETYMEQYPIIAVSIGKNRGDTVYRKS